jgi:transposase
MQTYTADLKEQIARKMMPPNNQSIAQLNRETGIPVPTLYSWRKQYRSKGFVVPNNAKNSSQWDAKAKLAVLMQTAQMNQAEQSEYCREHGLYPEQLNSWKQEFESVGASATSSAELAAERKKTKKLEKELRRKDKALAEAAALLVLQKKAQAIWGINEED